MRRSRAAALLVVGLLVLSACSDEGDSQTTDPASVAPATAMATTDPATTDPATTEPTAMDQATTSSTSTTTTTSTTSTVPPTEPPTEPPTTLETTTTVAPGPVCVVEVMPGDSLNAIVAAIGDPAVTVASLQAENAIADVNAINAGQVLDVCVGNGIDDTTGAPRVPPATDPAPPATPVATLPTPVDGLASGVQAQQQKLNELFGGHGLGGLTVDGQSGRLTRQQLCAARVALNLPISRDDMAPGGAEEQALMSAAALPVPATARVSAGRWALIDQTCQIMFVGDGNSIMFVFGTSTGMSEFPTRNTSASRAFRFDPALDNGGWHDSIDYPAAGDNPLNGNMYKPIYFDNGQAIHGANNVPTDPKSHGCARLRVGDQDALVDWLGLSGARGQVWDKGQIGLTVTVQGRY